MSEPRHEYVRIGLPLPVDVFGALGTMLDKAWPGASIITDPEKAGVPQQFWGDRWRGAGQELLVKIDASKRPKAVTKKAAREAVEGHAAESDEEIVQVTGLGEDDGHLVARMSAPEQLMLTLAPIAMDVLDVDGAHNYVEIPVRHPDHDATLLITVARSKGQTPHQVRMKAEEENERLRALLSEHGIEH